MKVPRRCLRPVPYSPFVVRSDGLLGRIRAFSTRKHPLRRIFVYLGEITFYLSVWLDVQPTESMVSTAYATRNSSTK